MCTTATRMTNFHHKRLRELGNLGRAARRGSQSLSATTCITHESPSEIFLTRLSSVAIHTYTYTYTLTFSHSLSLSLSLSRFLFSLYSLTHTLFHIYIHVYRMYTHTYTHVKRGTSTIRRNTHARHHIPTLLPPSRVSSVPRLPSYVPLRRAGRSVARCSVVGPRWQPPSAVASCNVVIDTRLLRRGHRHASAE